MIRPDFWDDEKLSTISRDARLIFIALWNFSDDYGTVKAHPVWLKNHIFPYDEGLKLGTFTSWLKEIETLRAIIPFQDNGESYYFITNFKKHQTINHPSNARNPEPPGNILEHYRSPTVALPTEVNISKVNIIEKNSSGQKCTDEKNGSGQKCTAKNDEFEQFWATYPKKKNKGRAESTWNKLKKLKKLPDITIILTKLDELKKAHEWTKEDGEYIPHPASWLNAAGWNDEVNQKETEMTPEEREEWGKGLEKK